ncbi:ANM_HP_G0261910.mRNA.1.CDS.1 [Saccharomyces cerevisiae]|nr:ANM_HP_G0261910.mRNA.1.CDS.1 [Saccharomyces cerevisiae]CAI7013036.1 ANM_HP_G0261910.mRNA.1.CDS.1 [Saccharomyces cerevisiae]
MKKEKKTPTPLPSHHVLFAEQGFFLCNFFFRSPKAYTNKSFFYFLFILLFIIYIAIIYFVFIRISHFFFSLCRQCNSLGRMIFMCAYLPAASSRSVANPALPPQKKKKKKKKGTLRTGEVEEQAKGNISFDLCGKQNFQ